jgi:hypothetical protein
MKSKPKGAKYRNLTGPNPRFRGNAAHDSGRWTRIWTGQESR